MPIIYDNKKFHLYNSKMSYCMEITKCNDIMHTYWGRRIQNADVDFMLMPRTSPTVYDSEENQDYSLEAIPLEYPFYGTSDLREPAAVICLANGCRVIEPRYSSHKIYSGKPTIDGLPAVYTEENEEAETLEISLTDTISGVEIVLYYTVFENLNVICRSTKIKNLSDTYMYIDKISSASIDFLNDNYKYMHLYGAHNKEKQVEICDVHKGIQGFESRRGLSGHYENPFMAVMDKNADEDCGNVYGFSLVYSGNHSFKIESDCHEMMRVQLGINSFNFCWKLEAGECFSSPEAVMVYSSNGLGDMSRTYHTLYRTRLCRGQWRDKVRPVLINSWEAAFFDFDEERLIDFAKNASKIGVELFVLDDGWFGERNDDTTSLGDWFVNSKKLPSGIDGLAKKINAMGLKFGLWFEPEMVSMESNLYKAHPDWMFKIPGRNPHPGRSQYVLDLSREDVCQYVIDSVSKVLKNTNIEYVKWDMNRAMSDVYSSHLPSDRQGELMHRYILGLYKILQKLTSEFPNILFESCASGGGRYDPGMLYYMPQTWASDNTDALERVHIQYGTLMAYPASTMGAHVSKVPKANRITPLSFRGTVAMAGMFGYEMDLAKLNDEEIEEARQQVSLYKEIRQIITFGDYYRLMNTDSGNYFAWMYISKDKSIAVVSVVTKLKDLSDPRKRIYLKGLEENAVYMCDGKEYYGSTLMHVGIEYFSNTDYNSKMLIFKKVR